MSDSKTVQPHPPSNHSHVGNDISASYPTPVYTTSRPASRGSDRVQSAHSEVSPLTSPRNSAENNEEGSPDVSPIDPPALAARQFPKSTSRPTPSQLPVRKMAPATKLAIPSPPVSPSLVPASDHDADGRRRTSSPLLPGREERLAALKSRNRKLLSGFREQTTAGERSSSEPAKSWSEQDPLDHPIYREPWKGASGRTTLVDPVRNVPRSRNSSQPIPRTRVEDGISTSVVVESKHSTHPKSTAQPEAATPPAQHSFVPDHADSPETTMEGMKPIVPLKIRQAAQQAKLPVTRENLSGPFNPRYSDTTVSSFATSRNEGDDVNTGPVSATHPPITYAEPSPVFDTSKQQQQQQQAITSTRDPVSHFSWTTYGTTTPPRPKTPENDPTSRFSWTTYNTSVNESPYSTRRADSTVPPVPPVPYLPNASAMRMRAREPHSSEHHSSPPAQQHIHRKPPPSAQSRHQRSLSNVTTSTTLENPSAGDGQPTRSGRAVEAPPADKSKSLPQCPPEMEAKDRIAALEARRDDLIRRRRNITHVLTELKNATQTSTVVGISSNTSAGTSSTFTYAAAAREAREAREEGKRTIQRLEDELADVGLEERQVGMSLHRAFKKRDQLANYENPTGLWVKRVTS